MKANGVLSCRITIILFGVLGLFWHAQRAHADWTFAMLGDTRGNHETTNGVSPYLNAIATKIAQLHPDLVMVSGDLCKG